MKASHADEPVVVVLLEFDKSSVGERRDVRSRRGFESLWGDAVDATAVRKVDGVSADVGVMPVKNVNTAFGAGLDGEPNPGQVIGCDKVVSV